MLILMRVFAILVLSKFLEKERKWIMTGSKKEAVFKKAESLVKNGYNFERFKEELIKINKNLSEEYLFDIWFAEMVNKIPKEKLLLD